jgi:hypothetical protein
MGIDSEVGTNIDHGNPIYKMWWRRGVTTLGLLTVMACSRGTPILPSYKVSANPPPQGDSIAFMYDTSYRVGRSSIRMQVCRTSSVQLRIISFQEKPDNRRGYLVNKPFNITPGCRDFYPVIDLEPNEVDRVSLGFRKYDESCNLSYEMTSYQVNHTGDNITTSTLGRERINPANVIRRPDADPKDFQPEC